MAVLVLLALAACPPERAGAVGQVSHPFRNPHSTPGSHRCQWRDWLHPSYDADLLSVTAVV